MPKFAGKNRQAVTVEGDENIIYVVDKLNYGARQQILSAMTQISAQVGQRAGITPQMTFDVGAFNLAVAQHAIVGWEGPDFEGVEVTPENIAALDFDDELVKKAITVAGSKAKGALENTSPN